MNSHEQT